MTDKATTVYKFYDRHNVLLYVGITAQKSTRFYQHQISKDWWGEVSSVALEHYATRLEAQAREAELIASEKPRYNLRSEPTTEEIMPVAVYLGGPMDGFLDFYPQWNLYHWYWCIKPDAPIGLQLADPAFRQARYKFFTKAGRTLYYLFDDWGGWCTGDPQFENSITFEEWEAQQAILREP